MLLIEDGFEYLILLLPCPKCWAVGTCVPTPSQFCHSKSSYSFSTFCQTLPGPNSVLSMKVNQISTAQTLIEHMNVKMDNGTKG